jgi:DNA-binding transcriptional LysR family regulator
MAESGTLSEAARRLGLSLAATSRRLSQLESRLGVALVRRNSRHLSLTDEGAFYYERAGRTLSDLDDIEADACATPAFDSGGGGAPRVTLSTNDGELARAWVLDGAGIKSCWEVADDLASGRLQPVLPDLLLTRRHHGCGLSSRARRNREDTLLPGLPGRHLKDAQVAAT